MWYNCSIEIQTSTGAFNAYTRSNQCKDGLQMADLSIPLTSGIYVIANTKNSKVYIGKTTMGFRKRWIAHRSSLNSNRHGNHHLQAAWNKYGAKFFKFLVLEYCAIELLDEREKHHIAIYKARGLAYNLTDGGEGVSGRIVSGDEKLMRSKSANRYFSPEHRANITASKMGHSVSDETKRKIGEAQCMKFIATSPDGTEYKVKGLKPFCREHGLTSTSMFRIAKGKQYRHKGWLCRYAENE